MPADTKNESIIADLLGTPTPGAKGYLPATGVHYLEVNGAWVSVGADGGGGGGGGSSVSNELEIDFFVVTFVGTGTGINIYNRLERTQQYNIATAPPILMGVTWENLDLIGGPAIVLGTATLEALSVGKKYGVTRENLAVGVASVGFAAIPNPANTSGLINLGPDDVWFRIDGGAAVANVGKAFAAGERMELTDAQIAAFQAICTPSTNAVISADHAFEIRGVN
jgi:hypothetical protein